MRLKRKGCFKGLTPSFSLRKYWQGQRFNEVEANGLFVLFNTNFSLEEILARTEISQDWRERVLFNTQFSQKKYWQGPIIHEVEEKELLNTKFSLKKYRQEQRLHEILKRGCLTPNFLWRKFNTNRHRASMKLKRKIQLFKTKFVCFYWRNEEVGDTCFTPCFLWRHTGRNREEIF